MTRRRDDLDLDDTLYVVRDNLGKADAFITAAEDLIERPRGGNEGEDADDGDGELGRYRNHVAHLVESTKLAVRAAKYAGDQMATRIDGHRAESERATETTALRKHRGRA